MSQEKIIAANITKTYGKTQVLNIENLELEKGKNLRIDW